MSNIDNGNQWEEREAENVFRPSGGYQSLKVFQIATLIHDITVRFVKLYIPKNSRTCDQMEQAARSGKQNIAEGSVLAATSAKLEMNLYNVARGSMEELKNDYQDYLRQNKELVWRKNDPLAKEFIRRRVQNNQQFREFILWAEENSASDKNRSIPLKSVLVANAAILLITAETFWLKQLMLKKMEQFLTDGGFSEQLLQGRLSRRKKK